MTLGVSYWHNLKLKVERSLNLPNIKSQIKRVKTAERQRLHNKAVRTELKTWIKKFNQAVAASDEENAFKFLKIASKKLDTAARKGIIHKNNAANRKAAIWCKFNRLKTETKS